MPTRPSSFGHRAPLGWLLAPFLLGLIAGKLSPVAVPVPLALTLGGAAVIGSLALSRRRPAAWAITFAVGTWALGVAYYECRRVRLPGWETLPVREAELTVEIGRIFAGATGPDRLSALGRVVAAPPHLRELEGQKIALSTAVTPPAAVPYRGMTVRLLGQLEPLPRRPPDDDFLAYLVDAGINFRLGRGRLLETVSAGSVYARGREQVRQRASAALGFGLEEQPELAAALRGMLLGERAGLSEEQKALFLRSGTMHLFAISGLHIAVIAGGIITVLRVLRVPPLATFVVGSLALWGYVDLTGALPSAVRAWLMVVCLHGARVIRAPGNLPAALATSALLVLLLDPMQLFGAGFQMSYGIVASLLLYGGPLAQRWTQPRPADALLPRAALPRWRRQLEAGWNGLRNAAAIGVAASLIGLISGVAFFGLFTPLAVVANLPLIPLASLALLGGMVSLVAGLCGAPLLAGLFNHAAAVVIAGMQLVLEALTALPASSAAAEFRAGWIGESAILLVLTGMLWGYSGGWQGRPRPLWLPVGVTALVLAAGMRFIP